MSVTHESTERRPESVLASEADKRASTANGGARPVSQDANAIFVPDNTPRYRRSTSASVDGPESHPLAKDAVSDPAQVRPEDELEEDELFMTLTPEERTEWEAMLASKSSQTDQIKADFEQWSHVFTRRRMFAYSRMRKLEQCYADRIQLFTTVADALARLQAKASTAAKKSKSTKKVEKRNSEPAMSSSSTETSAEDKEGKMRRNETMLGLSSGDAKSSSATVGTPAGKVSLKIVSETEALRTKLPEESEARPSMAVSASLSEPQVT